MKTRVLAALLLAAAAFMTVSQTGCTVSRTPQDNARLVQRQFDREMLMLVEDCAAFMLMDHQSRLGPWIYQN